MKIALVYDRVNKFGGAERVLEAIHELWPEAPLFTAVYNPKGAPWAKDFDVRPSFLQHIPLARKHHELFPWLTPLAFESFSFDGFDVVISITSAEAKGIITKPGTLHICYCLTPTRYLWSGKDQYQTHPGMGILNNLFSRALPLVTPRLQVWDRVAASRPDIYLAISHHVQKRIETYYHRRVEAVIYPPVDVKTFVPAKRGERDEYFLVVSRLVGYKRVDILIDAFNALGLPLKVIGQGVALGELQRKAGKNIEFISQDLTDTELSRYYQRCRALVFAGQEDFGLVAGEAQASGAPVICYKDSGMAETVIDGVTGVFFPEQSPESCMWALKRFFKLHIDEKACRKSAERFDTRLFQKSMKTFVEKEFVAFTQRGYFSV